MNKYKVLSDIGHWKKITEIPANGSTVPQYVEFVNARLQDVFNDYIDKVLRWHIVASMNTSTVEIAFIAKHVYPSNTLYVVLQRKQSSSSIRLIIYEVDEPTFTKIEKKLPLKSGSYENLRGDDLLKKMQELSNQALMTASILDSNSINFESKKLIKYHVHI